ncbi:hypothetical protein F5B20DRAFT_563119 [Whalleya microplaca]|nr:hypothetical protein F5B20DRAFT_563119 [Whalleya microplaca]
MKLSSLSLLLLSSSGAVTASELQKPLHLQPASDSFPASTTSDSRLSSNADTEAPPYRDELVSLHKSLVEISSISLDENEVGKFLIEYLTSHGFVAKAQYLPPANTSHSSSSSSSNAADEPPPKPRFNVLAWPASSAQHASSSISDKPKVLVTSHIDTVPPFIPYSRTEGPLDADTLIAGRGTVDAKASVAAQIFAVQALLESDAVSADEIMLLYVVDEENGGAGMRHFSDSVNGHPDSGSHSQSSSKSNSGSSFWEGIPPNIKAAIFGEPTEGKLACGHKGFFGCTIVAHGKAGHSGYPWLGKSATEVLMRGLVAVLDARLGSSPEFGDTTVNVGRLSGGVASNVIAERAEARVAGRVAIGPELGGGGVVAGRLADVLRVVDADAFELDCVNGYGVVRCECEVPGFENITVNYGTDVPNFRGAHARYLYGPGSIFVAHGRDEAIRLGDLEGAVEDYKRLVLHAVEN